ncbi:MAG: HD domain-containing protein [Firmicutes bacterium]|nr:HD domain-containing protein [Bacillota bacterium]
MELKDIRAEQPVSGQYLIIENQLRTAKNGSHYLALKIGDRTGELPAKIWDADEELFRRLEVGKVIAIHNLVPKIYRDQIQLEWESKNAQVFEMVADQNIDYGNFLPQAPGNTAVYWETIKETLESIKDRFLKSLLVSFFYDGGFQKQFILVPAALKRHHAYLGGLLEHTAGVVVLCKAAADYYPFINRDLLLTGALLHDVGKIKTYKIDKGFDGTTEGKLIGHLILGVQMVEAAMARILDELYPEKEGIPEGVRLLQNSLLHLLVSHHGIMEWGSPIEPLTVEACVLHHADNMDAQVTKFLTVIRGRQPGSEWAAFDPGLNKSIFLGNINS